MEDVGIIGGSTTKFGDRDARMRVARRGGEARLDDAGVSPDDVEHVYVSNTASGKFDHQTGEMNALAIGAFEPDREG